MIVDALKFLFSQAAEAKRTAIRLIKTPSGIPGTYYTVDEKGEVAGRTYELAPAKLKAFTIKGFCDFIYNGLTPGDGESWTVFVGEKSVQAFYLMAKVPAGRFSAFPSVSLPLTPTAQWLWVQEQQSMEPKDLAREIRLSFVNCYKDDCITKLGPILSRISLKIVNQKNQRTDQNNDSLGEDVTKSLNLLNDTPLPSTVSVQVQLYKELDMSVIVTMDCYFDFDDEAVVLSPVQGDLVKAVNDTTEELVKQLGSGTPKPTISMVELTNLVTSNDGVSISG